MEALSFWVSLLARLRCWGGDEPSIASLLPDVSERMPQTDAQDDEEPPEKRLKPGNSESETTPGEESSSPASPRSSPPHSPDNIDVISNGQSPLLSVTSPAGQGECHVSVPQQGVSSVSLSNGAIVVKLESEEKEDRCRDKPTEQGNGQDGKHRKMSCSPNMENPATLGLIRHLQLPSDVLYLKEMEVIVHGSRTPSWTICSAIPLPKGSSLGPFAGDMVSAENVRVGDLIVEFHSKTGHVALVNVAGHSGAWLALLRPATNGVTRNTLVCLEGGRIWCEIVSDVHIGMELRAAFVFDLEGMPAADRDFSVLPLPAVTVNSDTQPSGSGSPPPPSQPLSTSVAVQQTSPPGHAALIYACPFCGVRFSSPRTLQGHLSYYCSKKKAEHIVSPRPKLHNSDSQGSQSAQEAVQVKQEVQSDSSPPASSPLLMGRASLKRAATSSDSNASDHSTSPSPAKVVPSTEAQTYQCTVCNFRAEKPANLNRHMRIHSSRFESEASAGSSQTSGSELVPNSVTYCKECNIQFSSLATYRGHKEHYCSQRHAGRATCEAKDGRAFGRHTPVSLAVLPTELSAASLHFASLSQAGLLFPPGQTIVSDSRVLAAGAMIPGGQMILTAPVLTPNGLTSMSIPLPSGFFQSIHNAAAMAAAAVQPPLTAVSVLSPRAAVSPRKPLSSSPPKAVDISPRSSCSAAPEEAHRIKSPKKSQTDSDENAAKELPLDLSKKRCEPNDNNLSVDLSIKREPEEEKSVSIKKEADDERQLSTTAPSVWVSSGGRPISVDSCDREPVSSVVAVTPTPIGAIPPSSILSASLLPGFLPVHAMAAAVAGMAGLPGPAPGFSLVPPPGVSSKCTDCGIPFYKRENLLIHKKHYCSGKKVRSPATANPTAGSLSSHSDEEPSVAVKQEAPATVTSSSPEPGSSQFPPQKDAQDLASCKSSQQPVPAPALPSPSVKIPVHSSLLSPPVAGGLEDVRYKFFCIPCNIKYSSASNLKAHKEFYCPHGKNSEHTIIMQMPSGEIVSPPGDVDQSAGSNDSSPSPGQYICTRCQSSFTSSRLLKLHLCSAEAVQSSLLRCAHCEYVTHTDKRMAEHVKVHNPTSAFRCTLCGYRGNTLRGMRMHGKTHTENGEDFTDSHMIEFQEPPLVPIQTNSDLRGAPQGPVDVEAELLRLKNEPYKRRRSRKAYEKVDIIVPLDEPPICQVCGECFEDRRSLVMHRRIHELASQYMPAQSRCALCDYTPKTYDDLLAHMEVAHNIIPREEKENHPQPASPDRPQSSDRRNTDSISSEKRSPMTVRVKEEPVDKTYELRDAVCADASNGQLKREPASPENSNLENVNLSSNGIDKHERNKREYLHRKENVIYQQTEDTSQDIDVGTPSDNIAVKAEPESDRNDDGDDDDDSFNDPPLPITFAADFSVSVNQPASRQSSSPSGALSSHSLTGDESPSDSAGLESSSPQCVIKQEPSGLPEDETYSDHDGAFSAQSPSGDASYPRLCGRVSNPATMIFPDGSEREPVKSYCKICDITFQQEATLIAHKKYYCPERGAVVQSASA